MYSYQSGDLCFTVSDLEEVKYTNTNYITMYHLYPNIYIYKGVITP